MLHIEDATCSFGIACAGDPSTVADPEFPTCVTARPPRPRPSYAVAPSSVLWARGTKSPNTPHHRVNIPCEDVLDTPMSVDDDGDGANSLSDRKVLELNLAGLQKRHTASTKQANRAALLDGACLRATIKDFTKARGQRPQNRGGVCAPASHAAMMCLGAWSSGMIRASGARGRGFDSRSSPAGQSRDARNPQRRPSRCSTSASRTREPRRAASTTAGRSRRTARSSSAGRRTSTARPRATTSRASPSPARSARPSRRATSRSTTST